MPGSQDFAADPRNRAVLISLNGKHVRREDARVSIFDGGFVVGDGIWEGLRLHRDKLLFLDRHMKRLYWGAEKIKLDVGMDRKKLVGEVQRLLSANDMHDGVHIRLMVTRGTKSAPNQDPRNVIGPPTIVIVAEYKVPDPALLQHGLALQTSTIRCSPKHMFDMRLNSHSRLNLIGALLEAIEAGADEALMLDPGGFISSCNATNFFWVRDGEVRTSTGEYCFNGITRENVVDLCGDNKIRIREGAFLPEDLQHATEAFVTGTFGGITPVRSIDGRDLAAGVPGPMTTRLRGLHDELKDEEAAKR